MYSRGAFKRAQIYKSDNTQPRVDRLIVRPRNFQGIRAAGLVLVWTLRHIRFDALGPLLTEEHLQSALGMGASGRNVAARAEIKLIASYNRFAVLSGIV